MCQKQYIGKSETPFNIRLNSHRNHITTKLESCQLAEHFTNSDHDFSTNTEITAIEKIKKNDLEINRKTDILRERERFWIVKTRTFQPFGLNEIVGY